jgi:hypothetical protein
MEMYNEQIEAIRETLEEMQNPPEREEPRSLSSYQNPAATETIGQIRVPMGGDDFELKPNIIGLINFHFHGLASEDPFLHLEDLTRLAETVKPRNVGLSIVLMKMFPFSLRDKASQWLRTLGRTIHSWEEMRTAFLKKFFPIGRTNALRRAITSFTQQNGEQFHEAWERYNDLLRKCPHHGLPKWHIAQIFYYGLNETLKQIADASCGGNFMNKDENGAFELFENMSENSMNNASIVAFNRTSQPRNVHEVDTGPSHSSTDLSLIAQKLDEVSVVHKKLDELLANPARSMANTTSSPLRHNPSSSNTRLIPRNPVRPSLPSVAPGNSVSHVELASMS